MNPSVPGDPLRDDPTRFLPIGDDPLLCDVPLVEGWKVFAPAVIYAKIGGGGKGAVYRGYHLQLDIDVAVMCSAPKFASDEHFVARFRREALASSLSRDVDLGGSRACHYGEARASRRQKKAHSHAVRSSKHS